MQEESKSVIIASKDSKDALPKLFTVLSETSIGIKKQLLSSPLSPIESITSKLYVIIIIIIIIIIILRSELHAK